MPLIWGPSWRSPPRSPPSTTARTSLAFWTVEALTDGSHPGGLPSSSVPHDGHSHVAAPLLQSLPTFEDLASRSDLSDVARPPTDDAVPPPSTGEHNAQVGAHEQEADADLELHGTTSTLQQSSWALELSHRLRPASDWDLYGGKLLARGIGSASIDPVERNVLAAVVAPLYILPGAEDSLIREARVYAQLEHLQGRHVARCYGLWRREYRAVLSPSGNDPNASRCDEEVYIIVTDDLGPSIAEEFGGYFWPEANEKYG